MQQKTKRPVQFEVTEGTRQALMAWIGERHLRNDDFVFPSRAGRADIWGLANTAASSTAG